MTGAAPALPPMCVERPAFGRALPQSLARVVDLDQALAAHADDQGVAVGQPRGGVRTGNGVTLPDLLARRVELGDTVLTRDRDEEVAAGQPLDAAPAALAGDRETPDLAA